MIYMSMIIFCGFLRLGVRSRKQTPVRTLRRRCRTSVVRRNNSTNVSAAQRLRPFSLVDAGCNGPIPYDVQGCLLPEAATWTLGELCRKSTPLASCSNQRMAMCASAPCLLGVSNPCFPVVYRNTFMITVLRCQRSFGTVS